MSKLVRIIASPMLLICLSAFPTSTWAAKGDCSQPVTDGANPTASDCLFILQTAVGSQTCGNKPCICDTGGGAGITASDALLCLKKAVDPANVVLACHCAVTTTSTSTSSTSSSSTTSSTTLPTPSFEGTGTVDEEAPAIAPALITVSADEILLPDVSGLAPSVAFVGGHVGDADVCGLPQS